MMVTKNLIIALNFVSAFVGAGLASGKEIAQFLGDANLLSILICATLIGAFSYPFIILGIRNDGNVLYTIFPHNKNIVLLIVKVVSFIFLGAMFSGAESLIYEISGIPNGSFLAFLLTLLLYELGDKVIKGLASITMPLVLLILYLLFVYKGIKIEGEFSLINPIIYAGLNTTLAGLYASNMCKGLRPRDGLTIIIFIAIIMFLFLLLTRSIVANNLHSDIPVYSVSKDTNLSVFIAISIIIAILTSCISSLKITLNNAKTNPYVFSSMALLFSMVGFSNLVKYLYPLIGIIGILILILSIIKIISISIKKHKKCNLDL